MIAAMISMRPHEGESDPLAELARLIGQTDPFASMGRANQQVQPQAGRSIASRHTTTTRRIRKPRMSRPRVRRPGCSALRGRKPRRRRSKTIIQRR